MRTPRPDLGLGLRIDDWTPAPGSEFMGAVYRYDRAKIAPLPSFLAQLIFEDPEACGESRRVLEFPSWLPH
jgi:hypothetical protein